MEPEEYEDLVPEIVEAAPETLVGLEPEPQCPYCKDELLAPGDGETECGFC